MRFFLDTEFSESSTHKTIDLISVGIVTADGQEYYAISNEFDIHLANEWVRENVLTKLPSRPDSFNPTEVSPRQISESKVWKSRTEIQQEILAFIATNSDLSGIEFWGDYPAYDWVVFCWLFGDMVDLPKGYPYYCNDINQWLLQLNLNRDFLPPQPEDAHNALADARWIRDAYCKIENYEGVSR